MERQESSSPVKPTLVSLNNDSQGLLYELTAMGGELTPEFEKRQEEIALALCEKVDGYGFIIERIESEIEFWKLQATKVANVKRVFENAKKRLEERMKFVLRQRPDEQLQGELYRFYLKKSKDRLDIDEDLLPDTFKITELKLVPDREKIEAAIAAKQEVPGVRVVTDNKALCQGSPKK